jgi:hypothetical protein
VKNLTLYEGLRAFTTDAGMRLTVAAEDGDEIPFEVTESEPPKRGSAIPLYCYRPLTGAFVRARLGLLLALPTYAPAARALQGVGGCDLYLRRCGEDLIPEDPRACTDQALRCFLAKVFDGRSEFAFDDSRFRASYEELERAIYQGRCVTEFVAVLRGVDLDHATLELALGDGLSIVRLTQISAAPEELTSREDGSAGVLLVLRVAHDRSQPPSVTFARARMRNFITSLRLYEKGEYALMPIGYARIDDGVWKPVLLGSNARSRRLTLISREGEDELRAFCSLIARRLPWAAGGRMPDTSGAGETAWALARFEMGSERPTQFEALSDYLLALRALLEPEGAGSGRLAQRLAVICAPAEARTEMAERAAEAIALERSVIAGLTVPMGGSEALVDEMADYLRAILRDVLCGHLDRDVRALADELLDDALVA